MSSETPGTSEATGRGPARRGRVLPSILVFGVIMVATLGTSGLVRDSTRRAEHRLLEARADDAANVISGLAERIWDAQATGLALSGSDDRLKAWIDARPPSSSLGAFALVDVAVDPPRTVVSGARRPQALARLGREQRDRLRGAQDEGRLIGLIGPVDQRVLVVAGPSARRGRVLYTEVSVSTLVEEVFGGPLRMAGALYAGLGDAERTGSLVAANTNRLPIEGMRIERSVALGAIPARLVVGKDRPLIGGLAEHAVTITLVLGTLMAVGMALIVEVLRRRRDRALALVVRLRETNDELDRLSEALGRQALHDSLTGLGNRAMLLKHMRAALDHAGPDRPLGLMIIDLDDFKEVNDTMGHSAGDAVLVEVARRLQEPLVAPHVAFRLAGDEFAVVVECRAERASFEDLAVEVIERIGRPVAVSHREVFVTASVGLAKASDGRCEELLRNADIAMYRAKERVVGPRWERFQPEMLEQIRDRIELAGELRDGIVGGDLDLEYQPIVDLAGNGRTVLVEALVRWSHAKRGRMQPASFIGVAEETGAIVALGEFVLRQACRDCAQLRRIADGVRVSVNVSGRQLKEPGFPEIVRAALDDAGIPPSALLIEITESVLIPEVEVEGTLAVIRDMGVGLAIDDFGSGYSSIDYLRRLPVDMLKVDRSVVQEDTRPEGGRLLGAIVQLGKSFDLETVAEGIATPAQQEAARACGFDLGQGFYFGRPCSLREISAMLAAERRDVALV